MSCGNESLGELAFAQGLIPVMRYDRYPASMAWQEHITGELGRRTREVCESLTLIWSQEEVHHAHGDIM